MSADRRRWLRENWLQVIEVLAVGVVIGSIGLWLAHRAMRAEERQAQAEETQVMIQSRAASLSCRARLQEPDIPEELLEQTANELYEDLFQQVPEYLAQNKDASYISALEAVLPLTQTIASVPPPILLIDISNNGDAMAEDVSIFMEWDREIASDISVPKHEECIIEKGGEGHSFVRILCERLVPGDTLSIKVPSNWGPEESMTERIVLTSRHKFDLLLELKQAELEELPLLKGEGAELILPEAIRPYLYNPEDLWLALHSLPGAPPLPASLGKAELTFYWQPSTTTWSATVTYPEGRADCSASGSSIRR
jgi:hypothetical protein